jgi:hypothetical protein
MRKSELKVGGEYAAGSSSRFGRWQLVPVRVVEIDGERPRPNGTVQRGIVVQLLEDTYDYRWRGKAGDEKVIDSARDLQCEWAPYVERKAANYARSWWTSAALMAALFVLAKAPWRHPDVGSDLRAVMDATGHAHRRADAGHGGGGSDHRPIQGHRWPLGRVPCRV